MIGVLGEDETDVRTLRVLIQRLLRANVAVKPRSPPRGGCAALRRVAAAYMRELSQCGCTALVFVHDLDRNPNNGELNDEAALRTRLEAIAVPVGIARLICIPVEELEAWFWSDQGVLDRIGKGAGHAMPSPHALKQPKEALIRLSRRAHGKAVYSPNMNPELAEDLDLETCAARCPAFRELRSFVQEHCGRRGREAIQGR